MHFGQSRRSLRWAGWPRVSFTAIADAHAMQHVALESVVAHLRHVRSSCTAGLSRRRTNHVTSLDRRHGQALRLRTPPHANAQQSGLQGLSLARARLAAPGGRRRSCQRPWQRFAWGSRELFPPVCYVTFSQPVLSQGLSPLWGKARFAVLSWFCVQVGFFCLF